MASQAPSPIKAASRAPRRLQKLSIAAMVIAGFNRASLHNVLASAAVAIAAPAAATAFVYEVSSLRGTQLEHEAMDRESFLRIATDPAPALADGAAPDLAAAPPRPSMGQKLDGMIASRVKILDIFGDDPSTVAPIYARIIKQMVTDDDTTLAALLGRPDDLEEDVLAAKEERLRAIHARLVHLLGA